MELHKKKCAACEKKDTTPFDRTEAELYINEVKGWELSDDVKKISKTFTLPDFVKAVDFVNQVADIAEGEGHHPDIRINYNKVKLTVWTHSIGGLSENDFILAAKIDVMTRY